MSDTLIKVDGVSKKFCRSLKKSLWYGMQDIGNELLGRRHGGGGELRPKEFWAVDEVSFEVKRGECLGLIGPNGAGKSTLLKMLNGLIKPDQGRIKMAGRVGALIELGAGFNPILSGRENIYVNGSVLGLSKREIDRKFDEIVEFAEIGEFLDTPVQNYSSGMKVRLGFAIAAQMEPDILIVDEVLAVGDVGFRAKCYNKISEISSNSAVVFVSHQMPQVSKICNKAIVLSNGLSMFYGEASKAVACYNDLFDIDKKYISEEGDAKVDKVKILNGSGEETSIFNYNSSLRLAFDLGVHEKYGEFLVSIGILDQNGDFLAQCHSSNNSFLFENHGNTMSISVEIDSVNLNLGKYYISIVILDKNNCKVLCWCHSIASFRVEGEVCGGAPIQIAGMWNVVEGFEK